MNNNNDFMFDQAIRDPRQTGAIPRTSDMDETKPSNYKSTIERIKNGQRICVILRGLPGSGKSHLAKQIIADTIGGSGDGHIISTDNYFIRGSRYQYDVSKLAEAHEATQNLFRNNASKGFSPLIVDNTNMKYWEMFCYFQGAVQYGYMIEIMEPMTPWRWSINILAQKTKHGVPMDKIKIMKSNYESGCSLEQMMGSLALQPVTKPKMRLIPPINLIELYPTNDSIKKDQNNQQQDKNANFNSSNAYQKDEKKPKEETNPFFWSAPPQVFENKWEPPIEKEIKVKEQIIEIPQPQRKQLKGKKSPDLELVPHRKNCPNENANFTQLRELFPNITDSFVWDLFVKCKGDSNWCAEIIGDDNKIDDSTKGNDLSCDCGSSSSSGVSLLDIPLSPQVQKAPQVSTNGTNVNNVRKQTPIKTKKVKSGADSEALKAAIEASIQIRPEFYPDHVLSVKKWKQPLLPTPTNATATIEDALSTNFGDQVIALSFDEKLILELDDQFGDGLLKFALDRTKNFPEKIFVNENVARQLYEQIMDTYRSQEAESQIETLKNDRALAQTIHENERTKKYPNLFSETKGDFKKIMENEEALKMYENDMNGYQKENETLAQVIKKQRLYKAFPGVDQVEINSLFEVLEYNFNATIKMLQENLGYSQEQCKKVEEHLAKDLIWRSDSSSDESESFGDEKEEYDASTNENGTLKVVEDLREEINHHLEGQRRCYEISQEKKMKKDFQTASYYIDMASLHKQMAAEKKLEVASMIAGLHAQDQESFTKLDLHYHNIIEATTMLNTFLDKNISRLRETKKQYADLSIITGRGARSKNGVATIKIMTIQQLRERNLRGAEDNPGLLRVKVYPNSILSTEQFKN